MSMFHLQYPAPAPGPQQPDALPPNPQLRRACSLAALSAASSSVTAQSAVQAAQHGIALALDAALSTAITDGNDLAAERLLMQPQPATYARGGSYAGCLRNNNTKTKGYRYEFAPQTPRRHRFLLTDAQVPMNPIRMYFDEQKKVLADIDKYERETPKAMRINQRAWKFMNMHTAQGRDHTVQVINWHNETVSPRSKHHRTVPSVPAHHMRHCF